MTQRTGTAVKPTGRPELEYYVKVETQAGVSMWVVVANNLHTKRQATRQDPKLWHAITNACSAVGIYLTEIEQAINTRGKPQGE